MIEFTLLLFVTRCTLVNGRTIIDTLSEDKSTNSRDRQKDGNEGVIDMRTRERTKKGNESHQQDGERTKGDRYRDTNSNFQYLKGLRDGGKSTGKRKSNSIKTSKTKKLKDKSAGKKKGKTKQSLDAPRFPPTRSPSSSNSPSKSIEPSFQPSFSEQPTISEVPSMELSISTNHHSSRLYRSTHLCRKGIPRLLPHHMFLHLSHQCRSTYRCRMSFPMLLLHQMLLPLSHQYRSIHLCRMSLPRLFLHQMVLYLSH